MDRTPTQFLNQLNQDYLAIHRSKEDLFWSTYMGTSDDHKGSTAAQTNWTQFLSDANQISEVEAQIELAKSISDATEKQQTLQGLTGWLNTFKAHAIQGEQSQALKKELIEFEAELFEKKQAHQLSYIDENGNSVDASLPVLASIIRTNENADVRQSAHKALLDLEQWLLQNGFIELVKLRNKFAQSLGYGSFFDYSVEKTEHMTTEELFTILDDFEQRTREANERSLKQLASDKGEQALTGYNFNFSFSGDVMRDLDLMCLSLSLCVAGLNRSVA